MRSIVIGSVTLLLADVSHATPAEETPLPGQNGRDTKQVEQQAPSRAGRPHRLYLGGGAFYLPIDDGLAAASAIGGVTIAPGGNAEARLGGRLAYGSGQYSSAFAVLAEGHMLVWWDTFGISAALGVGPIFASKKSSSGWDGILPGVMLAASPVRFRFGAIEPSLDVGILYPPGNDYPAPFVMPFVTGTF